MSVILVRDAGSMLGFRLLTSEAIPRDQVRAGTEERGVFTEQVRIIGLGPGCRPDGPASPEDEDEEPEPMK